MRFFIQKEADELKRYWKDIFRENPDLDDGIVRIDKDFRKEAKKSAISASLCLGVGVIYLEEE